MENITVSLSGRDVMYSRDVQNWHCSVHWWHHSLFDETLSWTLPIFFSIMIVAWAKNYMSVRTGKVANNTEKWQFLDQIRKLNRMRSDFCNEVFSRKSPQYLNRSVQQKLWSVIGHWSVSRHSSILQTNPLNWWLHHVTTERSLYFTFFIVFFVNFTHIYIM